MIQERPLGYGLETMPIAFPDVAPMELVDYEAPGVIVDRAHSKPLDLLVSIGPLGFLFYYGFLVFLILGLWKRRQDPLVAAGLVGMVSYSVAVLVQFDSLATGAMFWVVGGMFIGIFHIPHPPMSSPTPLHHSPQSSH